MPSAFDPRSIDPKLQLRDLDRADCEESLYEFLKAAWPYIDSAPWKDSWAIDAVAEHLQAVVDGQIKRLLINISPRCSKPVGADSLISTFERGLIPLSEVFAGIHVLTHMGRFRRVTEVHRQGSIPTLKVMSRSGRAVIAAPDHPFLTPMGWQELQTVVHQDVLGTIPQYMQSGSKTISLECARLLGYLVGDGACGGTPNITVADDLEAADIRHCIESVGFLYADQSYHMANTGYLLRRIAIKSDGMDKIPNRRKKGFLGPVKKWLERHGLLGQSSYTKLVPRDVLEGDNEIVKNFIGAYWACDGYITTKGTKRDGTQRDDLVIGCDSVNRRFLEQMQIVLLRIGISSLIRKKISKIKTKKQGDLYTSYSLTVTDQDNCWRFATAITIIHTKGEKLKKARKRRFDFDQVIRGEVVDEVTENGNAECICLTVEEDASFVANGFAVHNSSLVSVAFPAWTWAQPIKGPTSGPGVPFLYASYAQQLSLRDSVKCRRLIESNFYQQLWGDRFSLVTDQNTKSRFSNDKGGERLITSVDGATTGEGAQILCADDINAANEAFSEASIKATTDWWDTVASTRLNDPKTGAFIVIQQRLAEDDITGHILEKNSGEWCHLMIPMRYEPDRSFVTQIGWKDPRTTAGELMWPERFGEAEVVSLEKALGPMIANGQLQQRPEPAGGGVIKRDYWQLWERDTFPPMDFILASLDTAYTTKTSNDYSALTLWGIFSGDTVAHANRMIDADGRPIYIDRTYAEGAPKVMLMHAWRDRLELHQLVERVAKTCTSLKVDLLIVENKAAGHSVAQEIQRLYNNEKFGVQLFDPKSQDKLSRLYSVQHLFAEGIIYAPDRKWSEMVICEAAQFPHSKHDDLTDTLSQALRHLRDMGLIARAPERLAELDSLKIYPGRQSEPLYPA